MKQSLTTIFILTICAVCIGSVSHASLPVQYRGTFVVPTVSAPGDNHEWEAINEGPDQQDKAHGLTVTTFFARGDAIIQNAAIFAGILRGGTVVDPSASSILRFGDVDTGVATSVDTYDTVHANLFFQSDTLIPTPSNPGPYVCAGTDGTLQLCRDRCLNFVGMQPTVPTGWYADTSNNCFEDDVTISGPGSSCQYQMIVTRVDSTHADFNLKHNGSNYTYDDPNTPVNQPNLGRMDVTLKTDAGIPENFIIPHGHATNQYIVPNIGGTTVHATVLNVAPGTINGGEVCWIGY